MTGFNIIGTMTKDGKSVRQHNQQQTDVLMYVVKTMSEYVTSLDNPTIHGYLSYLRKRAQQTDFVHYDCDKDEYIDAITQVEELEREVDQLCEDLEEVEP